jgi:hypothetical protein
MQNRRSRLIVVALLALAVLAASPQFKTYFTQEQLGRGQAQGVLIDASGRLKLAPATQELFRATVPYLWCAVEARGEIFVGGGNPALVLRVQAQRTDTVFTSGEVAVFALAQQNNDLFFATSPNGQVYRRGTDQKVQQYFKPEAKYIWALEAGKAGALFVATGEPARIYQVQPSGAGKVLFESEEKHIRSLCWDGRNNVLYAGSSASGYVYRLTLDGRVTVMYDAPLDEIHRILISPSGAVYAAAAGGGPVFPAFPTAAPGAAPPTADIAEAPEGEGDENVIVISAGDEGADAGEPVTGPVVSAGGAGAVYRIEDIGLAKTVWNSASERVHALHLIEETAPKLLIGTGDKGKIYRLEEDETATLLWQAEPSQITSFIKAATNAICVTTANPGTVHLLGAGERASGEYISEVLDANVPSQWGALNWESAGTVQFLTRSGNTGKPDQTWSDWAAAQPASSGGVIVSSSSRFLQWKVRLTGREAMAKRVQISYLQKNVKPQIAQIRIFEPGESFPDAKENASNHASEQTEGNGGAGGQQAPAGRKTNQKGAQSLGWQVRDDNNDRMEFRVEIRAVGEPGWRELMKNFGGLVYTFDSQALPDGEYQVRLTVSDRPSNPAELAMQSEKISEIFIIDNTPPEVGTIQIKIENQKILASCSAHDRLTPLQEARYSVDAGDWELAYPADHVSDQKEENYQLVLPENSRGKVLALKIVDRNGNTGFRKTQITP